MTGSLAQLAVIEEETPAALSKLMKISGLGPKRIGVLHRESVGAERARRPPARGLPLLLDEHGVFRAAMGGLPDLPLQLGRDGVDGDRRPFASLLKTKDLGACLYTPPNRPAFQLIDLGSHNSLQNDFCLKWLLSFVGIASFRS
jgi:hypothetical protein